MTGPHYPSDASERERAQWANAFGNLKLFEDAAADTLATMLASTRFARVPPGSLIFGARDEARFVYVMLEGAARGYQVNEKGLEYTSKIFRAPTHFGELAALAGLSEYRASIAAITPVLVASAPIPVLEELLARDHALCRAWLYSMARQHVVTIDFARQHAFGNLSTRLANTLLSFADAFGAESDGMIVTNQRLSYAELARHTASTRRAAISAMQDMVSKRLVSATSEGWRLDARRLVSEGLPGRLGLSHSLRDNKDPEKK